ncbi:GNAT family N-acetyltransferase [Microcoleus sp. Pol12B4]
MLKYGLQTLGVDRIVAISQPENIASRRVMAKVGMSYEQNVGCWGAN